MLLLVILVPWEPLFFSLGHVKDNPTLFLLVILLKYSLVELRLYLFCVIVFVLFYFISSAKVEVMFLNFPNPSRNRSNFPILFSFR